MMLTAEGKHNEIDKPENARNIISWMPVRARPQPSVNAIKRMHPVR